MSLIVDAFAPPILAQHHYIDQARLRGPVELAVQVESSCPLPLRTRTKLLRAIHPDVEVTQDSGPRHAGLNIISPVEFWGEFRGEMRLVQRDPVRHWSSFHPITKAELTLRVCCIGAESTGKTTLVNALANKHDTHHIHEFGRDYTIQKQSNGTNDTWDTNDFIEIARIQQELEDAAALDSGPLLFCDTDAMTTALWHERYLKTRSREVEELGRSRTYDLFVLCNTDIPWENDGVRLGADTRASMHKRFLEVLATERNEPWVLASGSVEERIATVEATIEQMGLLNAASLYATARFASRT
jgi:nicotinamide riboside kinase